METRRLGYFVRIVECGSITRAAAECGIAQPALSQQLAILERELNAQLLLRSGQGVSPTPAGLALYRQAQVILRQVELAREQVRQGSDRPSGPVSIGLPLSKAAVIGVRLLASLRRRYPDIRPQLLEGVNFYLTELVINGRLDMAILFRDGDSPGLKAHPLFVEEMFLVGPGGEALPPELPLAEVARLPLILHPGSNRLRQLVDAAFAQAGLEPRLVAESDSLIATKSAVEQKLGYAVLSWSSIFREVELGLLAGSRVVEPAIARPVALCTPDAAPPTPAAERVQAAIAEIAAELLQTAAMRGLRPPRG